MWLLFGIATLIGCILLAMRGLSTPALWGGESAQLRTGAPYLHALHGASKKAKSLLIGVPCPEGFHLKLKPETGVDRMFKALGVSQEFRIGDPEFDAEVYIVAEDHRVGRVLHGSRDIRRGLLRLFRLKRFDLELRSVECHSGRLWVDYRAAVDFEETGLVANEVVPVLVALSRELEAPQWTIATEEPDPFVWKASVLVALSVGLLVNAIIQEHRLALVVMPSILDVGAWLVTSAVVALFMMGMLALGAMAWLKRSARTHLVILQMCLAGSMGCFGTAQALVADLNRYLDRTAPLTIETDVVWKHGQARRSLAYSLAVKDWRREDGSVRLRVSGDVYHSVRSLGETLLSFSAPDRLRLRIRRGALSIRYLEEALPIRGEPTRSAENPGAEPRLGQE